MNEIRENEAGEKWKNKWSDDSRASQISTGLFIVAVGGLALAKSFGAPLPPWLFSWQMLCIAIGLFIGFRKGFTDGGWFVPIIVGVAFLINDYVLLGQLRKHLWPLIIVAVGLSFIFRPKRKKMRDFMKCNHQKTAKLPYADPVEPALSVTNDYIDNTSIFSGNKEIILSKNFRGGDLVNIFGGCEIDLSQADMTVPAVLEVTAIFGGATLIIPSSWTIQSDAVTIFGGISDKRKMQVLNEGPTKTLILHGTVIFGGIEIKSY